MNHYTLHIIQLAAEQLLNDRKNHPELNELPFYTYVRVNFTMWATNVRKTSKQAGDGHHVHTIMERRISEIRAELKQLGFFDA